MNKKLLSVLLALVLVLSFSLGTAVPVAAAKPVTFNMPYFQTQFQWRASAQFGNWSYVSQSATTSSDFELTGNVLHTAWSYSPLVSNLEGESTVYIYDKKSVLWIEKEGMVSYEYSPLYGGYPVVNYFRGLLDFGGQTPSPTTFNHGVAYQWAYIFAPQSDTGVQILLPYAQWDGTIGAWLVGFSIYLWDAGAQSYSEPFPTLFPEPVPARNYNPLNL